ncbi:hypothetical protein P154DRAFT_578536 [Amniculicola lignicola CBS 123094]|uniref:Transmembrane protein n=1 Tax=Amniculicola lignicola CBS 123094 TaxID=1392246 RepID=A0A6A5W8S9_9PLEO|nr:hypothetical protein P154DRAFT_578536 [Amniculicola lignicola CBS 123094]
MHHHASSSYALREETTLQTPHHGPSKATMIGGTIGGILAFLILCSLILAFRHTIRDRACMALWRWAEGKERGGSDTRRTWFGRKKRAPEDIEMVALRNAAATRQHNAPFTRNHLRNLREWAKKNPSPSRNNPVQPAAEPGRLSTIAERSETEVSAGTNSAGN